MSKGVTLRPARGREAAFAAIPTVSGCAFFRKAKRQVVGFVFILEWKRIPPYQ